MLRDMIQNEEDVTRVCTTKVTDMNELFYYTDYNQDISSWDVSNVTKMRNMFGGQYFNLYDEINYSSSLQNYSTDDPQRIKGDIKLVANTRDTRIEGASSGL